MEQQLDISWATIMKVLTIGLAIYILFLVRDIVVWFCFALIISLLADPAINFLQKLKIPKIVSVMLIYLAVFGAIGLLVYLVSPLFMEEIKQFGQNIPEYFEKVNPILKNLGIEISSNFSDFTKSLVSSLQESSKSIFKAIGAFFGSIATALLVFILAFFISIEDKATEKFLILLFPAKFENNIKMIFETAQVKVAKWFWARVIACLYVGILSFLIFYLLNIKYALVLAIISGVLNFVPYVGPAVTYILAGGFALISNSWLLAFYVCLSLFLIQFSENNLLTPLLMKKFIDLPPILVLVSILVGGMLFGFLGTIFAIPVFGIIYEFLKEFLESRRKGEIGPA